MAVSTVRSTRCRPLWLALGSAFVVLAALASQSSLAEDRAAYDASACQGCHGTLANKKQVHTALSIGTCADCHVPGEKSGKCQSLAAKGWRLKADEPKLCRECHPQTGNAPIHPVIDSLGCTACHDPHASDNPTLLKTWPLADLCKSCHEGASDFPFAHTPVKQGQCLDCHDPHASADKPLLKSKPDALCIKCHKTDKLLPNRYGHAPVNEGACTQCHSAHGSKFPKNTLADAGELCMKCHDVKSPTGIRAPRGVMSINLQKQVVHPVIEAGGCLECHVSGHSGAVPRLLKKKPVELCTDCHGRQDDKPFVHGALRAGDCAVCHEPHASDVPGLLRKEKPAETCFLCHADDATGRDFVHKPVAEGKCTACHASHGAANEFSLTNGSGKAACYACHKSVDGGKNKHLVLERSGCVACHDPHASNNRFFLPKPVNALCQTCHTDKLDGTHVTNFIPKGHKISGGPDPHNLDRDFSCASCHNPHGSDSPKLLRFAESPMESCDWCHGDRTGKRPELKDITHRKRTDKQPDAGTSASLINSELDKPASAPPPAAPAAPVAPSPDAGAASADASSAQTTDAPAPASNPVTLTSDAGPAPAEDAQPKSAGRAKPKARASRK